MPLRLRKSRPLDLSFYNVGFFLVVLAFNFIVDGSCNYDLVFTFAVSWLFSEVRFLNCVLFLFFILLVSSWCHSRKAFESPLVVYQNLRDLVVCFQHHIAVLHSSC